MKRGTLEHPKLLRLARLLGVERYVAAGILESLWHWTSRYARRGDVGRYSDDEIAEGIGWRARPASELLHALIQAGWVDRSEDHRLVIHDVADHADEAWRKSVARSPEGKGSFVKSMVCGCPDNVQTVSGQRLDYPVPVPVPVPEPEPGKEKLAIARQKKAPTNSRATTWPEDFTLTEERAGWAHDAGITDIAWEWNKFKDHALANGVTHKNWNAAWRYWIRNAIDYAHRRRG